MKNLLRICSAQKIRTKLIAIYLVAGILPFMFFSLYSYQKNNQLIVRSETSMLQNTLNQAVASVNSTLDMYSTISDYIFNDPGLLIPLNEEYGTKYASMYDVIKNVIAPVFQTYYSLYPLLNRITVYTSSDLHQYLTYVRQLSALPEEDPWFAEHEVSYTPSWISLDKNSSGELVLVRKIGLPHTYPYTNILYMKLDKEGVFSPMYNISENPYAVLITDATGKIFFIYDALTDDGSFNWTSYVAENDRSNEIQTQLPATDWHVYYIGDSNSSFSPVFNAALRSYLITWLAIVALVLMGYFFISSTTRPIENLTHSMRAFGEGDMDITASTKRSDEIGQMVLSFNEMAAHIRRLIQVTYNDEIEKKELSLRLLYAQINPHFLYNFLSIINSKAIIAEQHEISEIAKQLASFYRSSLNHGRDDTTVANEMENIHSYVSLKRILCEDGFTAEYDIEPSLFDVRIPNFILQPIVENAIDHGLRNSDAKSRLLCICTFRENGNITFIVKDNGVGIDSTTQETLCQMKTNGYGLSNVNDRLRLIYGDAYHMQICSVKNEYTSIQLTFPLEYPD